MAGEINHPLHTLMPGLASHNACGVLTKYTKRPTILSRQPLSSATLEGAFDEVPSFACRSILILLPQCTEQDQGIHTRNDMGRCTIKNSISGKLLQSTTKQKIMTGTGPQLLHHGLSWIPFELRIASCCFCQYRAPCLSCSHYRDEGSAVLQKISMKLDSLTLILHELQAVRETMAQHCLCEHPSTAKTVDHLPEKLQTTLGVSFHFHGALKLTQTRSQVRHERRIHIPQARQLLRPCTVGACSIERQAAWRGEACI